MTERSIDQLARDLCDELGLPYESATRIAEALREAQVAVVLEGESQECATCPAMRLEIAERERLREEARRREKRLAHLEDAEVSRATCCAEHEWLLRNLLAVAHRDGGHHTEAVGLAQSAADAERAVADMLGEIDVMRPLTATLIAMVHRARERMDPKLAAGLGQDLDRVLADAGVDHRRSHDNRAQGGVG